MLMMPPVDPMFAFMGLGPVELMVVSVVAVLLFGSRLPSVARSAGKSLTEFKRGMHDLQQDVRVSIEADDQAIAQNKSSAAATEPTEVGDPHDEESHEGYPRPTSPPFEPNDA